MRICAITMVYRDYWALSQWYAHYARHLGAQHLYVVAHGADPKVAEICPGASVITIPRDRLDGFDAVRGRVLNGLQTWLGGLYDWIIRTDADELICLDPEHWADFPALFAAQDGPALFALGFDLAEAEDDPPLSEDQPALQGRKRAVFSGHYSKAFAVNGPVDLVRHGVQVKPRRAGWFNFAMPRGVYLAHLKYANIEALEAANTHRREVAQGTEKGLPGAAWRKPLHTARKFFAETAALPHVPWAEGEETAWTALSQDPLRDRETGIVRARSKRFAQRTTLPGWFETL